GISAYQPLKGKPNYSRGGASGIYTGSVDTVIRAPSLYLNYRYHIKLTEFVGVSIGCSSYLFKLSYQHHHQSTPDEGGAYTRYDIDLENTIIQAIFPFTLDYRIGRWNLKAGIQLEFIPLMFYKIDEAKGYV